MPVQEVKKLDFEDESVIYSINKPLLLEASAGSGKTTVLVERYLTAVLFQYFYAKKSYYESVHSVVAVTFTRKAASEMKDRIRSRIRDRFDLQYLKKTIDKLEKYNNVRIENPDAVAETLLNSKDELMQAVLSAPISTIHSFALSYLRAYPVESGIDPFAVTQDETGIEDLSITSADALTGSLRNLIRAGDPDLSWMIKTQGYEQVREMIKELDGAVNGLGMSLMESALRNEGYFEYEHEKEPADTIRKTIVPLLKSIASRLGEFQESVPARSKPPVARAIEKIERFLKKDAAEDIFRDDIWYDGTVRDIGDVTLPLYEKVFKEKIKVFFPYLWRVYSVYWKTAEDLKDRRKEISFSDIEIKFLDMLRSKKEIRNKIRDEIRFILVDEFQDTSDLQKEIFDILIYGGEGPGTGKKPPDMVPFMVGDPKQSIFGFRNANLEVFHETRKEMNAAGDPASNPNYKRLNRNYRSTPRLVRDINDIFKAVFRESGKQIEYQDQEAVGSEKSSVQSGAFFFPAVKEEGKKVYERSAVQASRLIRQLVAVDGFAPGEIMVLLRKKTNMGLLKNAFDEQLAPAGINYYIVEDIADILQNREVKDLIVYLKALENRESDHYFLSLLKSPFFRKSDPEILALRRGSSNCLYEATDRISSGEMRIFNALYLVKNRMTIPELAEEIVMRTGYFAYLNSVPDRKEATTNLIVFLDFLRKIQDVEMFSLTDFLYYLQEYQVSPRPPQVVGEKSDVVRVMTVHMAKGLQARAVVYIAPYRKTESEKIKVLVRKREGRYGVFLNLFEKISRRRNEPMKEYLTEMQREEEKRLAYVAVTRAEERFYYFGLITETPGGIDVKNDFWSDFIRSDLPCFSGRMLGHESIQAGPDSYRRGGRVKTDRKKVLDKMEYLKKKEPQFAYERHPRILTVTQLLDMEFIGEGFRNRYITRSFPVDEALNEIADLSDILHESNPNADMGTYIHRIYQLSDAGNFRDHIERTIGMENEAVLAKKDEILSMAEKFFQSPFYRDNYTEADSSFRELEVNYNHTFGADSVLIKGSVDQYIRKKGKGILVDYKLKVPEERSRYERQLHYYSYILGTLGYPVDEMVLYDIMQNREVRVERSGEDIEEVLSLNIKKIAGLYLQAAL